MGVQRDGFVTKEIQPAETVFHKADTRQLGRAVTRIGTLSIGLARPRQTIPLSMITPKTCESCSVMLAPPKPVFHRLSSTRRPIGGSWRTEVVRYRLPRSLLKNGPTLWPVRHPFLACG